MAADPFFPEGEEEAAPSTRWEPPAEDARRPLSPVEVEQVRECHFKKKKDGKRGCERCGLAKNHISHLGAPGSLNLFGSGANQFVYQGLKRQWMDLLSEKLTAAGLPKGLGRVLAEGQLTFPDRTRRDQGNYRFMIEKALGDALKEGGWLEDDDWTRYEFGGLAYRYEKGVSRTRLILFPSWTPADPDVGGETALF